jgi:hypothetical protein
MLIMCTTICSVPMVLLRKRGTRAVWVSPDRGLHRPLLQGKGTPKGTPEFNVISSNEPSSVLTIIPNNERDA